MTKNKIENVIKRFPIVDFSIKNNLASKSYYIGNRKYVLELTGEIKIVYQIIKIIYEEESNMLIKRMMKEILSGKSDIYIMSILPFSRNAYYARKQAFIEKVYNCCIALGLVSLDEILKEEIAS